MHFDFVGCLMVAEKVRSERPYAILRQWSVYTAITALVLKR
jgi:hypothetical protein